MGGGKKMNKKKQTAKLQYPPTAGNFSAPARNLNMNELGAVIFGCKNNTIDECYSNLLFGLPSPHIAYVRNIKPGLPLFLFNYSDRTLHGIFEASSCGQLNINPYGWTDEGTAYSPYPAQVKVHIQKQCHSLTEDQFKPIIADNYYEHRLFWFELDQTQTRKLIALFSSSSPVNDNAFFNEDIRKWDRLSHNINNQGRRGTLSNTSAGDVINTSEPNCQGSERKWSSLFKSPSVSQEPCMNLPASDESNVELGNPGTSICMDRVSNNSWEADQDEPANLEYPESIGWEKRYESLPQCSMVDTSLTNDEDATWRSSVYSLSQGNRVDTSHANDEVEGCKGVDSSLVLPNSDETKIIWDSYSDTFEMNEEGQFRIDATEDNHHKISANEDWTHCSSGIDKVTETKESDTEYMVHNMMQQINDLKGSQLKQIVRISSLEQELAESKQEIQQLVKRCNALESRQLNRSYHVEVEYEKLNRCDQNLEEESVLIVGGFDGYSWLRDIGSYCPSLDRMRSLSAMTFLRKYASAAKSNGELYLFGGVFDDIYYDTVEAYNPINNQWVARPSLNRHKGSLAGVSMYDKIYAIGGGNSTEVFSEVEMLDPNSGIWMLIQSMQDKRLGPAAAEIGGVLYVVGGYDGRNYMNSVERFDPREGLWTGVGSMNSNRGCHSLVVLNEKLYAIGGYDGSKMVSTVEIFDPRVGSWMLGDPMINSRGYSGAFTTGERIYVVGGMKDDEFFDSIECYTEGRGWEITGLNGIGRRCHFSAILM